MVIKSIGCVRCKSRHTFKMDEYQYAAMNAHDSLEPVLPESMHNWIPLLATGQCNDCWIELDREFDCVC